jgi:glycosyltransferase involved in cell wall biosynthesis
MRILHYLQAIRLEDGGVVRAVLDMCTYQARAGHEVVLATCDGKDVPETWRNGGGDVPRVERLAAAPRLPTGRGEFARQLDPLIRGVDAVHLHVVWDPSQVPLAAVARARGKPYVQSPHGMLADWSVSQKRLKKAVYWSLFGRRLIDGAAFVVVTAQGELDQSAKRHPKTRGVVIPLVFDIDPYRALPDPEPARRGLPLPPNDVPLVLYLSRLHYKKRPDLLIAAARQMRDMGAEFRLVLAGPCAPEYDRQLRDYAKQLGVDDITTFLGMVPAALKPSLYAACDLFVLPTSMENFGFVYFESLASGTPVVTTRGTDTWRELEASGGGHIVGMIKSDIVEGQVGGGDVAELARTTAGLLQDRGALRREGQRGRQWVLDHLAPEVVVRRYIDMYREAQQVKR